PQSADPVTDGIRRQTYGTAAAVTTSQSRMTGTGLNHPISSSGKLVSRNGSTSSAGSTVSRPRSSPAGSAPSRSVGPGCCRTASSLLSTLNEGTHLLWADPSLVHGTTAYPVG